MSLDIGTIYKKNKKLLIKEAKSGLQSSAFINTMSNLTELQIFQ